MIDPMPLLIAKSLVDFKRNLRAQVRRYWNGVDTRIGFVMNFQRAIERGFRQAFRAGAAKCGVKPADYTIEMRNALQEQINMQFVSVMNLSTDLVTKEDGGLLGASFRRIEIWIARYGQLVNLAKSLTCGKRKLKWVLGLAEHCPSCKRLNGTVKPANFWSERGIIPRQAGAWYLDCKGYNCKCTLTLTDEPITRGRFPILP